MKSAKLTSFLIVLSTVWVVILIGGCQPSPNVAFIQGGWIYEDPHLKNLPAEQPLTAVWVFDQGVFHTVACCFNIDLSLDGRYSVLSDQDNVLTLELFDVSEPGRGVGGEIRLVIDRETDTLNIQGTGPFTRIEP